MVVHDELNRFYAIEGREKLHRAIKEQLNYGGDDLAEEDKWLTEVNLQSLDDSTGEREAYWVLVIEMARERFRIQHEDAGRVSGGTGQQEEEH